MKGNKAKRRGSFPIGLTFLLMAAAVTAVVLFLYACQNKASGQGESSRPATAKVSSSGQAFSSSHEAEASSAASRAQSRAASSKSSASDGSSAASSRNTAGSRAASAGSSDFSVSGAVSSQTATVTSNSLLMLVNKTHLLSESYTPSLTTVSKSYYLSSGKDNHFNVTAAPYLVKMLDAAKADGVALKIVSGYRTYAYQQANYNRQVNALISKGYSSSAAVSAALTSVAYPGSSEHETGLSADIITPDWYNTHSTLTSAFDQTSAFRWLDAHAAEYGFILRYPKGKSSVTGYEYEPWHYRFVGVSNAGKIKASGLCLEEWLQKNPS